MVLGLKSRRKTGSFVKLEYIVHVREIRPWPPSDSLRSVQTFLLQWENGDQYSGSFLSVAGDFRITFDESFILPLSLKRDKAAPDKFLKNYLEFTLSESKPGRDKAKGKTLGKAVINLADYGVMEEIASVSAPINLKKNSSGSLQPVLFITLDPVERDNSNSSPSVISKQASLDRDDSEFALFSDEDASSHSSRTFEYAATSSPRHEKNGLGNSRTEPAKGLSRNFLSPTVDEEEDTLKKLNGHFSSSKFPERTMSFARGNPVTSISSSPSSLSFREVDGKANSIMWKNAAQNVKHRFHEDNRRGILEEKIEQKDPSASGNGKSRLKHATSSPNDSSVGFLAGIHSGMETIDIDMPNGSQKREESAGGNSDSSRNEWKARAEMLEEELRESAAIELALYSIVSEHSSSGNKVHTPARRLCRFYTNAYGDQDKRASAARAAVSGLILVSRACGNDVPRLTFWLSNAIMLRSLISHMAAELSHSSGKGEKPKSVEESDDWEDTMVFVAALEKIESWLFTRIVESIWWQTFTPHMQPAAVNRSIATTKTSGRRTGRSACHDLGSFSMELWKKAFKDSCERLCPVRAGGHECGCLASLVVLVMEQLVNRLDIAMFNAILRESDEEMPTDPVSDPISDPQVLPIPAGKSSFTAGAHLKNVIGSWSRWLSDLFGLDNEDGAGQKSFKAFRLLHALSDLMMLPFEMLADASTRNEVCPLLGTAIIRRVLVNFVPDEFCPKPVPRCIIDALDLEEAVDSTGSSTKITNLPCSAGPTRYSPPPAALLSCDGEVGSQVLRSCRLSSVKKFHSSDDELDELDSPLTSIVPDSFGSSSALSKLASVARERRAGDVVRYGLLREVWKDENQF